MRIERDRPAEVERYASEYHVEVDLIRAGLMELGERTFVSTDSRGLHLTPAGCEVLERLLAARRVRLEELAIEWPAGRRAEVAAELHRLASEVVQ
jgi:hypothetical protein